ncbi:MAG: c-type cytochrome [Opitutae bacterium]
MRYFIPLFVILIVTIISILGFRGDRSKNTPIEVFPDMDRQAKFKAQTANPRFADGSADRLPVPGAVLRGTALDSLNVFSPQPQYRSSSFLTGKLPQGDWVKKVPSEIGLNMKTMRLGKEKYDIHCSVCHGDYGNGLGVTAQFGLNPRNLSDPSQSGTYLETAAPWSDGQLYHAISNGSASGIMLGLKDRLSPEERWSIVLYLRALQNYVGTATLAAKGQGS